MLLFSNKSLSLKNYFSFLLSILPICFVAGNLLINANILILILSALIFFKSKIFQIKYYLFDKLLILFFFLIFYTGFYNDYFFYLDEKAWKGYFSTVIKSIFFFRYLFLYFILRYLVEKKIIDLKPFFITCALAAIFVSLDIFYQFIFGKDIFGFETSSSGRKLGGPFEDELIAGSFIQRFCIFSFFILPLYFQNISKYSKFLIPILFIIFFVAIILSGNRMPMLLFIFSVVLILIFNKQTRKFLIPFVLIFTLLFGLIFNFNKEVRLNFKSFYAQVSKMIVIVKNNDFKNERSPEYLKQFETFYETWLMNKYIGGGIKNFRYFCHERPTVVKDTRLICNMHPHNYYLEILTETGLVGFLILVSSFLLLLYQSLIKKYFLKPTNYFDNKIVPFIFLFIVEIFPLKSTGSFFTTGNSSYLFLLMGILVGLLPKNNSIENKV